MIAPRRYTGGLSAPTGGRAAARPPHPPLPVPLPDQALWARVIRYARCADSTLDPDQWFPVSAQADKARHEAAAAIAVCTTCLVRTQCLELSLRSWDSGQHGVWGGLVPADRAALRRQTHPSTQSARYRGHEGPGMATSPAQTTC